MTKVLIAMMTSTAFIMGSPVLAADTPSGGGDPVADGTLYKKILGQLPANVSSAISVTRDGNATKVTFDIEELAKPMASTGFKVSSKPITLTYTSLPDGTIKQTTDVPADIGVDYQLPIKPTQSGSFTYQGLTFNGIIDPKLAFYRDMTLSVAKAFGDVSQEANGMSASVVAGQNGVVLNAVPAGDGVIDIHQTQTLNGFVERIHTDPSKATVPGSGPAMDIEFKVPAIKADIAINGFRSIAARDAFLFLLDNRSSTDVAAKQVEFKQHMRDLVPLLNRVAITGEAHGVAVQSPFGQGLLGAIAVNMALDTHAAASSFSLGERFDDIKLDSVFMPAWSKTLVPTALDLEFDVTGLDIAGTMTKFVDAVDKHDFTDPKPDTTDYEALGREGIMPNGGVHIDLKPSFIVAPTYKISWQGGIDTHGNQAKAHIDVTATGLDDIIKTLTPVRDKGVPETIIGLYAAKALAKPGPDGALLWTLDLDSATGALLVNGKPIGPQKKQTP